ncbi:MAG TPA: VOC family protein [Chitinophagaceae bacterium]
MATIVHFDISANDPQRAKKFYEELFGWKFRSLPGMAGYYEIETANLIGKPGIGGGLTKRNNLSPTAITNYIGVSSIDDSLAKVETLGGKIIRTKQVIPGYGLIAVCTDTENNTIGLFQEDRNAVEN